jgi:polar amino acid transport system substrate-binding protein
MKRNNFKKKFRFIPILLLIVMVTLTACGQKSGNPSTNAASPAQTIKGNATIPGVPTPIKERGKLVIGVKVDYPPFGFIDAGGKNDGFEIEMAKKLAEYAFGDASKIEFVGVNASNRVSYLNTKKIDFILATMGVTEQRKQEVDFSMEYFKSGVMTMVPKDSDIKSAQDLVGKKAIVIKGSTGSKGLEELVSSAEQIKMDNTSDAVRALKDKRGAAFVGDDILLIDLAKNNSELKVVGEQFNVTPWSIAVRKGEKETVDWLNKAIEKLKNDDLFYTWFNKWLPTDSIPLDPTKFILRPEGKK